jgi:preprotein translocase subunit Sec63
MCLSRLIIWVYFSFSLSITDMLMPRYFLFQRSDVYREMMQARCRKEIKKAYRKLTLQFHPDKFKNM